MRTYWWLFWLIPISTHLYALALTTRGSYRGQSLLVARGALFLAFLAPLIGVYGLLDLQELQTRDQGNLVFEGIGLWVAFFGLIACVIWLLVDRRTGALPAWISLGSALWTAAVWILIVAAI